MDVEYEVRDLKYTVEKLNSKIRVYTEAKITGKIHLAEINQLDIEHKMGNIDDKKYIEERRALIKGYKDDMMKFISKL